MGVDVVAPADPAQLEAEAFDEVLQIGEGHVLHRAPRQAREQLPAIHALTVSATPKGSSSTPRATRAWIGGVPALI